MIGLDGGGGGEGGVFDAGSGGEGGGAAGTGETDKESEEEIVSAEVSAITAWTKDVQHKCIDLDESALNDGRTHVESLLKTIEEPGTNVLSPKNLDIPFALFAYGSLPLAFIDVSLLVSGAEQLASVIVVIIFQKAMETCSVLFLYGVIGVLKMTTIVLMVAADTRYTIYGDTHLALTTVHATHLAMWVANKDTWCPVSPIKGIRTAPDQVELFRCAIDTIFQGNRAFGILDIKAVADAIFAGKHLVQDSMTAHHAVSLLHKISSGYHTLSIMIVVSFCGG